MKRKPRRRFARVLDIVLVLALLVAMGIGFVALQRARQHVAQAQGALGELEGYLSGSPSDSLHLLQDPNRVLALQSTLATLDGELEALETLARPILLLSPYLGWLPGIGPDIKAAPQLFSLARETTDAVRTLSDSLLPLALELDRSDAGLGQLGPEMVGQLSDAQPQIERAYSALTRAAEARAMLQADQLSPKIRALVARFDRYQPALEGGLQALTIFPELLGAEGPRSYLVVAQNNHELRATGGFVSGVGLIRVDGGLISSLGFLDSYAVDNLQKPHPSPPDALRRHMGAGMLLLRDANWWPDFPTSAQAIADLYRQDQGQEIDGVVSVDLFALQYVLDALGPIQVPNYEQAVDSGNLESMIVTYWQAPRQTAPGKEQTDWWEHRKDFAADLTAALVETLTAESTTVDLAKVAGSLYKALQERHILLYVNDVSTQDFVEASGLSGRLEPASSDYGMVVDSNVGFNKVNPNIEQTVDYQIVLDESGSATALLTLTYRHRVQRPTPACIHESAYGDGYEELMERCYWDLVRIYLPAGTEVLDVLGADEPAQVYAENGKTVVSTFFLLETDQARQVQVAYRPQVPAQEGHYELVLQKQPGTGAVPVRVSVTLPPGARVISAAPMGIVQVGEQVIWQGDLAQDRVLDLEWKQE